MGKTKEIRKALEEQLTDPLDKNSKFVEEFAEKNPNRKDIYRLKDFISYKKIAQITLNRVSVDDVNDYASMLISLGWSKADVQNLISTLNDFKDYLIKTYSSEFDVHYLCTLNELRDRYPAPRDKGRALNLAQLGCIRQVLKNNPRYRKHRFVFEVYFQLGIHKEDLQYCTPERLDDKGETWFFKKPDGTKIELNEFMKELVIEYRDTSYMEENKWMVNNYLHDLTDELRSRGLFPYENNLIIDDIKKTRKHFFMTCPNCKKVAESFADNWVLAKADTDSDYHLVCKFCKGEPRDENISN